MAANAPDTQPILVAGRMTTAMNDRSSHAPARSFFLEIVPQDSLPMRLPLPQTALVVGRSARQCQLALDDPRISRVHLRIVREPDLGVTVTDLFSGNGARLDGRRLEPGQAVTWLINQTVEIGGCRLTLRYGDIDSRA